MYFSSFNNFRIQNKQNCNFFSDESKMDRIVHELEGNRKMANRIAQQVFSVGAKVIYVHSICTKCERARARACVCVCVCVLCMRFCVYMFSFVHA